MLTATDEVFVRLEQINREINRIPCRTDEELYGKDEFWTSAAVTTGAGASMFDTSLGKPIWSDGSQWVDATGATVQAPQYTCRFHPEGA